MSKFGTTMVEEALRKSSMDIDAILAGRAAPPVEEVPSEEVAPIERPSLGAHQVWFSDWAGWSIAADFPVDTYFHKGYTSVPELDLHYTPDRENTEQMVRRMQKGKPVLMAGPPGTGKTEWCKWFCAKTGRGLTVFDMNASLDPSMLVGQKGLKSGETTFHEGDLLRGIQEEGHFILFDEASRISAAMGLAVYQPLLNDRTVRADEKEEGEKRYKCAKGVIIAMADNTKMMGSADGKFATANTQDTSTVNRLRACFEFDYPTRDKQSELVRIWQPSIPKGLADKLAGFATLCQASYKSNGISLTFSLRNLKEVADEIAEQGDPLKQIRINYLSFLEESELAIASGHLKTVHL